MHAVKLLAIVLIVAGTLGLVYGGFTYTMDTQKAHELYEQRGHREGHADQDWLEAERAPAASTYSSNA